MSTATVGLDFLGRTSTRSPRGPVPEHPGSSTLAPVRFTGVDSSAARGKWKEELILRNRNIIISGSQKKPPWVRPAFSKIRELVNLDPGWDSHDAESVVADSVFSAVAILNKTMSNATKTPWIVPTVHGGIQIEWHRAQVDLEIEIEPNGTASVFYVNEQNGKQIEAPFDVAQVRLLLDEFE